MGELDFLDEQRALAGDFLEISSGVFIKNLDDLLFQLKIMDSSSFSLYVSRSHNIFSDFIFESLGLVKLSKKLRNVRSQKRFIKILEKFLSKNPSIDGFDDSLLPKKIIIPKSKDSVLNSLYSLSEQIHGGTK